MRQRPSTTISLHFSLTAEIAETAEKGGVVWSYRIIPRKFQQYNNLCVLSVLGGEK